MRESSRAGGRLRLTVDGMRGSPGAIRSVVDTLRAIPGVREVAADALTGSVAFRYEPHHVATVEAGQPLAAPDALRDEAAPKLRAQKTTLTRVVETVVIVALEVALQRALGPFWPKRC